MMDLVKKLETKFVMMEKQVLSMSSKTKREKLSSELAAIIHNKNEVDKFCTDNADSAAAAVLTFHCLANDFTATLSKLQELVRVKQEIAYELSSSTPGYQSSPLPHSQPKHNACRPCTHYTCTIFISLNILLLY